MSKTKIRQDQHSLYIRGAGYIWRPEYPPGYSHVHGPTKLAEGDEVSLSHSGGPTASVKGSNGGIKERWYSHGTYYPGAHTAEPRTGRKLLQSDQYFLGTTSDLRSNQ